MTTERDEDAGEDAGEVREPREESARHPVTRVTSLGVSPVERSAENGDGDPADVERIERSRTERDHDAPDRGDDGDHADADIHADAHADAFARGPILPRPRRTWARLRKDGLSAAAVAAAGTAGALVAFGIREGGALDAFTGAGRRMLGIAATEGGAATVRALLAGVGAHLVVCLLWGMLFAALAARRSAWRAALTALLLAAVAYSATDLWLPSVLRLGYGLYATRPQQVVLHLLLAGGLWVGTRLAQYGPRSA